MDKSTDDPTDAIIKALQSIQSDVQNAKAEQPSKLPQLLSAAMSQTNQLLSSLPPSDAKPWLSELSSLTPTCIHEKVNPVPCIHKCGDTFCSATCRRQLARAHAKQCRALRDATILRKMGLMDKDLF